MTATRQLAMRAAGDPMIGLTPMQKKFLSNLVHGMPQTIAARAAGYATPDVDACRMMKNPRIVEALRHMHRKHEKASMMTRKKVMDGLLEAIEMAKLQADAKVMVAGWREIGHMCGYYAPERKVIDINVTGKRTIDKLETMSDAELLKMIEQDSEAIEAEFTEVLEAQQEMSDAAYADED